MLFQDSTIGESQEASSPSASTTNETDKTQNTTTTTATRQSSQHLFQRLKEIFICFLPLGIISFGGPQAHVALLQQRLFVDGRKWLSHEQFIELFAIGQSLPGPTSTQMVIAVGTLHGGFLGGLLAFLLFSMPGCIVLFVIGSVLHYYGFMDDGSGISGANTVMAFPIWLTMIEKGFSCVAVALVASAAWKLSQKIESMMYTKVLVFVGAVFTILFKSAWLLPTLLVIGGIYSVIHINLAVYISKRLHLEESKDDYTWKERFALASQLVNSFINRSIGSSSSNENDIMLPDLIANERKLESITADIQCPDTNTQYQYQYRYR
jgi:chromate transport protein ChrA